MKKCTKCGHPTRYADGICRSCRTTPTTAPAVVIDQTSPTIKDTNLKPVWFKKKGGKKMKKDKKTGNNVLKTLVYILGCVIALALATVVIWAGILFIMDKNHGNDIATLDGAAATDVIIDKTADETDATTAANGNSFSLGVPADIDTVDPSVWNEPMQEGVLVDANGTTVYTQSGKDGSVLLKGKIPDGQALVLDSYAMSMETNGKTESYSGGNILVLVGPFDLDSNPISYTDGAAQSIGITSLQDFLDENVAVKFARGDWNLEKDQWSYEPWALNNVFTPDGYEFHQLVLTYETDNYPNKTTATDMTVNN